jgi:hypothetical protein
LYWSCLDGECLEQCSNHSYCDFNQFCVDGACQDAYSQDTPYCKACDPEANNCGSSESVCFYYPYINDPFGQTSAGYCATACKENADCPQGWVCGFSVVVDPADQCIPTIGCSNDLPCLADPEEEIYFCPCHEVLNPCPPHLMCQPFNTEGHGWCVEPDKVCGIDEGWHCPL